MQDAQNTLLRFEQICFSLLILFLPTQFGRHFWPDVSILRGVRIDYLSPTLYLTDCLLLVLFCLWFVRTVSVYRQKQQRWKRTFLSILLQAKWLLLFLCFILVQLLLWNNFVLGGYFLLKFLECTFLAYYIATNVTTFSHVLRVILLLGIGILVQSLMALGQFWQQASIGGLLYYLGERTFTGSTPGIANAALNGELVLRPYGTFSHPNVLAGFLLCILILFLFTWGYIKEQWKRIFWVCILLLGTMTLLLTMSRVAIGLWLLVISGSANAARKSRRKGLLFLSSLALLGICVTPLFFRFFSVNLGEESVIDRLVLSQAALSMIGTSPLFGIGLGNFLPVLSTMHTEPMLRFFLQPVHNIFLLVTAEVGIIGLVFFCGFLVATYKHVCTRFKEKSFLKTYLAGLIVCLSALLILGMFDHYLLTLQQGQLLFALVIGLCWGTVV